MVAETSSLGADKAKEGFSQQPAKSGSSQQSWWSAADCKLAFIMFPISTAGASQDVCPSFLFLQCPKPNDKQMSSSQIIQHSWGTAHCAALPSRCSSNILTAVFTKKTVGWCFCCFDIHSSVRPRLHTQLNCSVFTHTGRLPFGNQTDAKNKTIYAKQTKKASLLNP